MVVSSRDIDPFYIPDELDHLIESLLINDHRSSPGCQESSYMSWQPCSPSMVVELVTLATFKNSVPGSAITKQGLSTSRYQHIHPKSINLIAMLSYTGTHEQRLSALSRLIFELKRAASPLLANINASLMAYHALGRELDLKTRLHDELSQVRDQAMMLVVVTRRWTAPSVTPLLMSVVPPSTLT